MQIETNFYTITGYTNFCHVSVYSSWDESVMKDYIKHRTAVVLSRCAGKNRALHTPDAEKAITQRIKTTPSQRPANYAFIVGTSEIKEWQINNSLTEPGKRHTKYFKTLDEGKRWLTSLGYEMTPLETQENEPSVKNFKG